MRKLLSSMLALTLMFACYTPCAVYASDKVSKVKKKTTTQNKEIDKLTEELKQQLKKIDELKNMSKDSYRWYSFKKHLSAFSKILLGISVPIATFFFANKYGFSNGFSSGFKKGENKAHEKLKDNSKGENEAHKKLKDNSICGKDYADGFSDGYKDYISKYSHYLPEDVPSEADIKSLYALSKKILSPEAFYKYRHYFKNGTKIENFYKQAGLEMVWINFNNIMDKRKTEEKTHCTSNSHFNDQNDEDMSFYKRFNGQNDEYTYIDLNEFLRFRRRNF